jgi:hypothetical protein
MLVVCLIGVGTGCAVGGDPGEGDEAEATQSALSASPTLTVKPSPLPTPQIYVPVPNRMIWGDGNGTGVLWIMDQNNQVRARTTMVQPAGRQPVGVAGDRMLWSHGTSGGAVWKFDDNAVVASTPVALTSPDPSRLFPAGLSLAQNYLGECWSRNDTQNFYVLWDSLPTSTDDIGSATIQLIDGTGYVRRTTSVRKPFAGLRAIWFGKAADGFERLVFASGTSGREAYIYRADFQGSVAPPTYALSLKASVSGPAGYRAVSSGLTISTALLFAGTFDQVLFASWSYATDGGQAQMPWLDGISEGPVMNHLLNQPVWSAFAGGNGLSAAAFTSNPTTCQ